MKIKKLLKEMGVDSVLLTDSANMRYVAGFTGEGYVYLSKKRRLVVTDSRYTTAAKEECEGFEVVDWADVGRFGPAMTAVRKDKVKCIGAEDLYLSAAEYRMWEKKLVHSAAKSGIKAEFRGLGDRVDRIRSVKKKREIKLIERAEAIGDEAFSCVVSELKYAFRGELLPPDKKDGFSPILKHGEKVSEKTVAALLEFYMKRAGAEGFSFETIAASGANSAKPHAVPSDRIIDEGDLLTMDFGCVYGGYCSDMTRTVSIGRASIRQKKIYDIVLMAQRAACAGIRPGMKGAQVDKIARDIIKKSGYGKYFGHSLGHSVGLKIHEKPGFSKNEKTVILPGMVISVEPGIYIPGEFGVRIEDLVVVTEDGINNLAHSPKELLEI